MLVTGFDDKIWGLNDCFRAWGGPGVDKRYKNVKVTSVYAPESQLDRAWRKTVDNLSKDKTCQFTIADRPYDASS